ncbi:MAG: substrate-binding domain-containing protein [Lachnospiraceae bacterium]|nr:substrate-binding domain-containing protein [Lachnospiraceae bacterium]
MKRKKWISILLIFVLVSAIFFLVERDGKTKEKNVVMIVKIIDSTNDFWTSTIKGANMAAKEYGISLTVLGPDAETKYEEQGAMIQEAIAMKPDAIVLSPASYTETPEYAEKIEDAGIELILMDSVMEKEMGSCVVATDNVDAGKKMGNYIAENFPEDVNIGVVGHVQGSSTAIEREEGLRAGLGDLAENIVDTVFCDSDYRKAYKVTKEMLKAHPEINVIAGLNEYSSVGAARAVIALGLEDEVHMIGFDSSLKEVEFLESEVFEAIVVQKPLNMGYLAVENTVRILQKKDVPQYIDSGSVLITKETMYTPENQKLLFPI